MLIRTWETKFQNNIGLEAYFSVICPWVDELHIDVENSVRHYDQLIFLLINFLLLLNLQRMQYTTYLN